MREADSAGESTSLRGLFSDLDLSEARKTEFKSLHDCFTRELKPGLRPPDPDPAIVASPSDGIVGAFGRIADTELFQVKGAPYSLLDLLGDPGLVEQHRRSRPACALRSALDFAHSRNLTPMLAFQPTCSADQPKVSISHVVTTQGFALCLTISSVTR